MSILNIVALVISIFVGSCNLCVMIYAFKTFLSKPRTNLESRVTEVEVKVKEIDSSLKQGNDRFRVQDEFNEMFIRCMLGFISFEVNYCLHTGYEHNDDLLKTKELLETYLAKR